VAFEDETWVELLPTLWKSWYLKGKQLEIMTPGINKRINVFITLFLGRAKTVHSLHARRTAREMIYHAKKLLKMTGKMRFKKTILFMDNTPVHRSRRFKNFIKKNRDRLKVYPLPEYSPNLNKVEKINRNIKRDVCSNRYHDNVKELKSCIRRYLKEYKIRQKLSNYT